jgi:hypothetical protein
MRARGFARLDHLEGCDDVAGRGIGVTRRRVHHDEISPLSHIRADESAGLLQGGPRLIATPDMNLHFGL